MVLSDSFRGDNRREESTLMRCAIATDQTTGIFLSAHILYVLQSVTLEHVVFPPVTIQQNQAG